LARLREEAAAEAFDTAIEELDRRAFEERYTLTDAAQAMNLTIQQVASVAESTTVGDWALAANAEVLSSLFTPEGLDGENSAVIALDDGRAVVVRVTEYFPAAQLALADVESTIRQELKQEEALAQISAERAAALDQLKEGASVTAVANELNKRWVTYELISRVGMTPGGAVDVPQNILNEAFALARPVSGDKTVGAVTGPNGSALVVVTRVMPGDVQATSDELIAQLSQQVVSRDQQREFAAFFAAAEQSVGVSRGE
jgi:peptidyl-prolyl cis-trans isomerase D